MNQKYQVFVSSTYEDLIEERRGAAEAILTCNCIPVGMEIFPGSSKTPWELIKTAIEECDFYILILAGRYGSIIPGGKISYTEKEYQYAKNLGKPIIPFFIRNIENLPAKKVDFAFQEQLQELKTKVMKNYHFKLWDSVSELKSVITNALTAAIRDSKSYGLVQITSPLIQGAVPVLIGNKQQLENNLSLAEREYGAIKIRLVNFAGTSFLANKAVSTCYSEEWRRWFKEALNGGVSMDITLTNPESYAAKDAAMYKMYPSQGCEEDVDIIRLNWAMLNAIEKNVRKLKSENPNINLIARKTEIALPYALMETIFEDNKKNHIKVDLYSPLTNDDNERPSFMIYKKNHPALYNHFSKTISSIASEKHATITIINTRRNGTF